MGAICNLEQNKELAKNLGTYLHIKMQKSLEGKEPFKLSTVMGEIYDIVFKKSNDHIKALGIAGVLPSLFLNIQTQKPLLFNSILKSGANINAIGALLNAIEEAQDPTAAVAEFMDKGVIAGISEILLKNSTNETPEQKIVKRTPSKTVLDLKLLMPTLKSSTGLSQQKEKDEYITYRSEPAKRNSYNALQNIIAQKENSNEYSYEDLEFDNHKGFKLRAVVEKNLPSPSKNIYSEDLNSESIVVAIVDNEGNYLHFDESGRITNEENGKIAYFRLRKTDKEEQEKVIKAGINILMRTYKINDEAEIADEIKFLRNQIENEARDIEEIKREAAKDKVVLLDIVGGNVGFIDQGVKQSDRELSKFTGLTPTEIASVGELKNFKIGDYELILPSITFDNGISVKLIGLRIKEKTPELFNNLLNLLVDDLVYENGTPVLAADKIALFNQFVHTPKEIGKTGKLALINTDGNLKIYIGSEEISLEDKEAAKARLSNFLSQGGNGFHSYIKKPNNQYRNINITNGVLYTEDKVYNDFIFDLIYPDVMLDVETGRPMINNGYFNFEKAIDQEQLNTMVKTNVEEAKKITKDLDLGDWDVLDRSKLIRDRFTPEQASKADKWAEETPLFKIKVDGEPVITLAKALDIVNSDAFATFAKATITMYKGSNSTHLYHEAWHAFSQVFLTRAQRTKLYKGAATLDTKFTYVKKSGTPGGQLQEVVTVNLNTLDPNNKQHRKILEEFIAEEYRIYAMNGGKFLVENEKTNIFKKLFNKIWALLKGLFNGDTTASVFSNPGSAPIFNEMFNALYNAKTEEDLNMYQPNIKKAEFGTLNSGTIQDEDGVVILDDVQAELISKSIDGLIGQITNQLTTNNKISGAAFIIFKDKAALNKLYNTTIKKALSDRLREMMEAYEKNQRVYDDIEKNYHANNINILANALDNYGDINDIIDNKANKDSIIAYHLRNSTFKDKILKGIEQDPTEGGDTNVNSILSKNDKKANDFKSQDIATENAIYLIESLLQEEYQNNKKERVYTLNKLGFPQLISFSSFWNTLINKVGGEKNEMAIYNKLVEVSNKKISPMFEQLLERLGDPNESLMGPKSNKKAVRMWLGMIRSLNLQNINLTRTMFEEEMGTDKDGNQALVIKATSGKVSADYFNIKNNVWNSRYNLDSSPYITINPENKQNQLNLDVISKRFLTKYKDNNNLVKYRLNTEATTEAQSTDPIEFLNAVGIYVSDTPEIRAEIKQNEINYLANAIGLANFNQLTITNPVDFFSRDNKKDINAERYEDNNLKTYKSKIDSNATIVNTLALLEAEYSTTAGTQMVPLPSGDGLKSIHSLNSTTSRIVDSVNHVDNLKELDDTSNDYGYYPNYNAERNPKAASSIYRNSLFNNVNGEKNKNNRLILEELVGAQYKNAKNATEGLDHGAMNENDKFLTDLVGYLSTGNIEAIRSGEKSTYYSLKIDKIVTDILYTDKKTNHLFFDTEDFLKDENGNSITNNNIISILNKVMLAKLDGELKTIKKLNDGITPLQAKQLGLKPEDAKDFYKKNVKGFENVNRLDWFDEILDSKEFGDGLKKDLIENYSKLLDGNTSLDKLLSSTEEGKKLKAEIEKQIGQYFDALANEFYTKNYKPLFGEKLPAFLKALTNKKLTDSEKQKVTDDEAIKALMMSFAVNTALHSDEIITLVFGDGIQFNHKKAESTKRVPTYNSPGIIFTTGKLTTAAINRHYSRDYEKKLIAEGVITERTEPRKFDKIGQKAIIKDPVVRTARYQQYHDLFRNVLSKRKYTKDEIDNLLYGKGTYDEPGKDSIMATWNSISKSDGQGYITFDYYRFLKLNEDNWTDKQEALYQKIINGEYVPAGDIEDIFPVYKLQYAGPLALPEGMYPIQSIDKFSLLPLIPSLVKDNPNMNTIHMEMMKQGVDYILFDSAAKRSYVKAGETNGDDIFEGNDTRKLRPGFKFTKNDFYLEYLKNQTEVNNYFKGKSTFATQFRKLFDVTLYANGVPVDFVGTKEEWDKLSESEKQKSEVYSVTEAALQSAIRLQDFLKLELYEEFGFDIDSGKPVENEETMLKMIESLKKKLRDQGYTEYELEAFDTDSPEEDTDSPEKKVDVSTSPIAARLEKFMFSVINNKLVRLKVNGEPFVQASNAFFHKFTKPTDEETAKYDDFEENAGYIVDPTGKNKTIGVKVKIALTKNYENLYKTKFFEQNKKGQWEAKGTVAVYDKQFAEDGKYLGKTLNHEKSFERLNQMLKVDAWLNDSNNRKKIQITGVRIPVQGGNSAEFAQVYEFLAPSAGTIIIIPAEIVAKSGGDFDVDKLTMYIKYITKQGTLLEDTISTPKEAEAQINALSERLKKLKESKKEKTDIASSDKELMILDSLDDFRAAIRKTFSYTSFTKDQKEALTSTDDVKLLNNLNDKATKKLLKRLSGKIKKAYKIYTNEIEGFDVSKYDQVVQDIETIEEQSDEISSLYKQISDLKEHKRNFASAIQNTFIDNVIKALELPQMAFSLLLPNGTYLAKPFADDLEQIIKDVDNQTDYKKSLVTGKDRGTESPSVLRNYNYNLKKQQDNKAGKSILGPIVLEIPANNLLNKAGALLNPFVIEEATVGNEVITLKTPVTLELNHNFKTQSITTKEGIEKITRISMSDLLDAEKKNQIADVLSQLTNGAVDVGKDAWVAFLQGNLIAVPKILFLLEAGVPMGDIAYFMNNPYIRKFIKVEQKAKSKLAKLFYGFGHKPYEVIGEYVSNIIDDVLKRTTPDGWFLGAYKTLWGKQALLKAYMDKNNLTKENTFERDALKSVAKNEANTDKKAIAGFLQYMYVQELTKEHDELKKLIDVDNNTSGDNSEAQARIAQIKNAKENFKFYDNKVIDFMKDESILSSFYIQDEATELFGERFFSFRANKNLLAYISELTGNKKFMNTLKETTGLTEDNFATRFKNALSLFVFTNAIKTYNPKSNYYKGKPISDLFNANSHIKSVSEVEKDFEEKLYIPSNRTSDGYLARGLRPIPENYLVNYTKDDFVELSLEREYLRKYVMPYTEILKASAEYKYEKRRLQNESPNLFKTMSETALDRFIYERLLINKALLNTYNNYQMFSADTNTVAKKLGQILYNYGKDLKNGYADLVDRFEFPTTEAKGDMSRRVNFSIKGITSLAATEQTHLNKLWKDLADPQVYKLSDKTEVGQAANTYISQFFAQLPIFAFLQSGMDSSKFNMNGIIPTDNYKPIMDAAAEEFTTKVLSKKSTADDFLKGFLTNLFMVNNSTEFTSAYNYDLKGKGLSYKKSVNELIKLGSAQPKYVEAELNKKINELSAVLSGVDTERSIYDPLYFMLSNKIKLLSEDDINSFNAELESNEGKLPEEFTTNMNQNFWTLNSKNLYDLIDTETGEVYLKDVDLTTGYQEDSGIEVKEIADDGGRSFIPGPSAPTQPSTSVKVISEDYGVVQAETNPTKADTQEVINLIAPQIEKQAYKENVGVNANWQFSFGNMWSRVNLKAKPLLINSFAGVNKVKSLIEELKKTGKVVDKSKYIYDYHELDQDGNPLPPISDLQPLIDKIQTALGIDMSGYDSVLGNIYLDKQSIAPHRDTTEAKSAEGYPVIVYTIGNDSGLGIWDDNKGKMTFQGAYKEDYQGRKPTNEILTKDGTVYTFGMNGKGRFNLSHTTPLGNIKKNPFPAIKLSDGRTLTNYTITLTFRRAADLTPGMPKTPAKLGTQPQAAAGNFEQLYNNEQRTAILAGLRDKFKDHYKDVSDAELVQRINNKLLTPASRETTIELLNKCYK